MTRASSDRNAVSTAVEVVVPGTPDARSIRWTSTRSYPTPLNRLPLVQAKRISCAPRSARCFAAFSSWSESNMAASDALVTMPSFSSTGSATMAIPSGSSSRCCARTLTSLSRLMMPTVVSMPCRIANGAASTDLAAGFQRVESSCGATSDPSASSGRRASTAIDGALDRVLGALGFGDAVIFRFQFAQPLLGIVFRFDHGIVCFFDRANELVDLEMERFGITILGVLNQKHHQEGNDGGGGIDDQLPGLRETEERPGDCPSQDQSERYDEGEVIPRKRGCFSRQGCEPFSHWWVLQFCLRPMDASVVALFPGCEKDRAPKPSSLVEIGFRVAAQPSDDAEPPRVASLLDRFAALGGDGFTGRRRSVWQERFGDLHEADGGSGCEAVQPADEREHPGEGDLMLAAADGLDDDARRFVGRR